MYLHVCARCCCWAAAAAADARYRFVLFSLYQRVVSLVPNFFCFCSFRHAGRLKRCRSYAPSLTRPCLIATVTAPLSTVSIAAFPTAETDSTRLKGPRRISFPHVLFMFYLRALLAQQNCDAERRPGFIRFNPTAT